MDSASVLSRVATISEIENWTIRSSGSVGAVAADAKIAAKQSVEYNFGASGISLGASLTTSIVKVTVGGVSLTVGTAASAATATSIATAINTLMNNAYGTSMVSYAAVTGSVVTVTAGTAGTALPVIAFAPGSSTVGATTTDGTGDFIQSGTDNSSGLGTDVFVKTVQANQVASDAVSASTFSASTGATEVTATAVKEVVLSAPSTAVVKATAGTTATVSGGTDVTVSAKNSVSVTGAKGAVSITTSDASTAAADITPWDASSTTAAGIVVTGGTTVSVTSAGTTTYQGQATARTINIGAPAEAEAGTTASGYPRVNSGVDYAPTGNVTVRASSINVYDEVYLDVFYGKNNVTVNMNGGTTASLTGITAGGSSVTDIQTVALAASATATAVPGTSKLSTVSVTGVTGTSTMTVKSDVLSALKVVDAQAGPTIQINDSGATGANNGALNLTVGNVGGASAQLKVVGANYTSVVVDTVSSAYDKVNGTAVNAGSASYIKLDTQKATSLAFKNANSVTLVHDVTNNSVDTLDAVTTITASGSGKVDLGDLTGAATTGMSKLATVDASAATGGVKAIVGATNAALTSGLTFTGGAGADTVTLTGAIGSTNGAAGGLVATTLKLGGGNDTLVKGANGAVTAGASVDAGDGIDTVSATLVNAGNAAIFKGFELLDVTGVTNGDTFDAALLTNSSVQGVSVSGNITSGGSAADRATVEKIAGTAITANVNAATIGGVVAKLATASGTADTATINFAGVALGANSTNSLSAFVTTGIETVTINSGAVLAAAGATMKNTLSLFEDQSNTTAKIVLSGSNEVVLGAYTGATTYTDGVEMFTVAPTTALTANTAAALKVIDASATSGGATVVAGEAQANIHSGSYALAYTGLEILGGSGNDKIVNLAAAGKVSAGAGNDTVTVIGSAATVDAGAGDDTIVVNDSVSTTLTGGAGKDTFDVSAAVSGTSSLTTAKVTTITDLAAGDSLLLSTNVTSVVSAQAAIASATTLEGAISAALSAGTSGALITSTQAGYFTYGGKTYILLDGGTDGWDASSGTDVIVAVNTTSLNFEATSIASGLITFA